MNIDTLLIANRGEIACRIMRTAKKLGLRTVAVHSAIDTDARHVREADMAVDLGGAKPAESYLLIDRLIAAAKTSGAQAIHPGYGFLSENAGFAAAIANAGLIFLGPPAAAIDAMGSKAAAKALMEAAGVPLVPGYHGEHQDLQAFRDAAAQIGYPVLLKATAGGGGKGMKIVQQEAELAESLASAQREARSAFADDRMLVEKYLLQPRHVEIQVFADSHGHCLYLNERDCSIQRRHQKVVEEAPAPGLTPERRRAMGEAAVRAALAIGYVGAGTVEFLLDAQGEFFFMEMNTRLQVEHPVTEAITGIDLVAWQIAVAQGEALPITQDQVALQGHAIEVRLYAEDSEQGFLPASGQLKLYREPAPGEGRRVDSGVAENDQVSPFYDPMLAKLIAWGADREQARQRLMRMLDETLLAGFSTNLAFLKRVLAHPAFAAAKLDTGFIERHQAQLLPAEVELPDVFWQLAAQAWLSTEPLTIRADDSTSPWSDTSGMRLGLPPQVQLYLECAGQRRRIPVDGMLAVSIENETLWISRNGLRQAHCVIRRHDCLYLEWQGRLQEIRQVDPIADAQAQHTPQGGLSAPMNGSIVRVLVEVGQPVQIGATLVVLEAMKMEHCIRAPHAGRIKAVHYHEGDLVNDGAVLIELEPEAN